MFNIEEIPEEPESYFLGKIEEEFSPNGIPDDIILTSSYVLWFNPKYSPRIYYILEKEKGLFGLSASDILDVAKKIYQHFLNLGYKTS